MKKACKASHVKLNVTHLFAYVLVGKAYFVGALKGKAMRGLMVKSNIEW